MTRPDMLTAVAEGIAKCDAENAERAANNPLAQALAADGARLRQLREQQAKNGATR